MQLSRLALLALVCWGPAHAREYSEEQHGTIWKARLQAAQFADGEAAERCGWKPEEPITFADDLHQEDGIRNPELFLMLSGMIRKDQNALAVYNSFHDGAGAESAAEALRQINSSNLASLKKYFERNGFPGVADIGNNGVNALLLLVAHADEDPDFQNDVLEMTKKEAAAGNLPEYTPSVLDSLRPRVGVRESAPDEAGPATESVRRSGSPRQCFFGARSKLISSYLRNNLAISD